jgi:hypothetical protein
VFARLNGHASTFPPARPREVARGRAGVRRRAVTSRRHQSLAAPRAHREVGGAAGGGDRVGRGIGDMNGLFAKGDGKASGLHGSTQHLLLRSGVRGWCRWDNRTFGSSQRRRSRSSGSARKRGQSSNDIARALGKLRGSIYTVLSSSGGHRADTLSSGALLFVALIN